MANWLRWQYGRQGSDYQKNYCLAHGGRFGLTYTYCDTQWAAIFPATKTPTPWDGIIGSTLN